MSAVFERLLTVFFSPASHNFQLSGIQLEFFDGSVGSIVADVGYVIADAEALHSIYGCKGTSGLKPCLCCINVYNKHTSRDVVDRDKSGESVYHTSTDVAKFKFVTPAVLSSIVRRLASATSSERKELETRLGWKYLPAGVMFDQTARRRICPSKKVMYDWAHIIFVNGVFNSHAGLLLHTLRKHGVKMNAFADYVKTFTWPHAMNSTISPKDVFATGRFKSTLADSNLKATCSEGLSLLPVVAVFCDRLRRTHENGVIRDHADCFVMLALVVSMVMRSARRLTDHTVLQHRISAYVTRFKELYGDAPIVPKFHMLFHVGFDGQILNCIVHERKHKAVKKYCNIHFNTSVDWDRSVLREITCDHIGRLKHAPMVSIF